jgi:hypothetical protein
MALGEEPNEVSSGELRPLRRSIKAPNPKSGGRSIGSILTVSRKIAQDLARPLSKRVGSVGELPVQISSSLLPHVARQTGSLDRWGDRDLIAIKERWSSREKILSNDPRGLPRASNAGGRSLVGSETAPSGLARKLLRRLMAFRPPVTPRFQPHAARPGRGNHPAVGSEDLLIVVRQKNQTLCLTPQIKLVEGLRNINIPLPLTDQTRPLRSGTKAF